MVEHVSYVSQTINKIRWKPISFSLEQSDLFVTGSCEEYVSEDLMMIKTTNFWLNLIC